MKKLDIKLEIKKYLRWFFKLEEVRDWMVWGTYGKSGKEPLKWVTLKNMSDEHIQAILDTQTHITNFYRREFLNELEFRNEYTNYSIKELA